MAVLAFSTLPTQLAVQGSGVFNLMRNFGSSLFISLSILVLGRTTAENYAGLSAAISSVEKALAYSGHADNLMSDKSKSLAMLSAEIYRQASMGGYLNTFTMFTLVAAAALPIAWMFRVPKR
jgi:MFS transporter, DHA2 family, multidrug resistance protein